MATKVAINGFGRIGRAVARIIFERKGDLELVAINDLSDAKSLAHLFKYDTVEGKWKGTVEAKDDSLIINGKAVKVVAVKNPAELPWKAMGVDIVVESTGIFTKASSEKGGYADHIKAGAKRVILSAPSKDDTPMFVMGVNHKDYKADMSIVSNASCTTNCLAPIAKVLNDNWGILEGLMTTVHAVTATQKTVDAPSAKDWRGGRGAGQNIIPSSTGAAKAVGKVIPELKGKVDGMSFRVPVATGSITDISIIVEKLVTVEEINNKFKEASVSTMKGIVGYEDKILVSSDFIGSSYSCIFDANYTKVINGNLVKIFGWYDNEWGYSTRLVDLVEKLEKYIN